MSYISRYENILCPVCKQPFSDNDDVVVCPDCGTPHHRECYKYVGHCVNHALHKTGFSFYEENKPIADVQQSIRKNTKAQVADGSNQEQQGAPNVTFSILPPALSLFEKDSETIDGEKVIDIAATVRTNAPRFVNIFRTLEKGEKKTTWNWGAFFFGSLYYFYRKLYRQAISLISIFVAMYFGLSLAIAKFAPKTLEAIAGVAQLVAQNKAEEAQTAMLGIEKAADFSSFTAVYYVFIAAVIVLRIIEALMADRIYKKSVTNLIKKVKKELDEGAEFTTPIENEGFVNLSQEQKRLIYLARRGGTNVFAPMIAILAVNLLLRFFGN